MRKILIVDDDESILDALSMVLEDAGYAVLATLKGDEIHKKVKSYKPDLILLDMLLSGNDGRHICQKLKADAVSKAIPIVMISAHPNAYESAIEAGAEDFLAKPFERDVLLAKIKEYV